MRNLLAETSFRLTILSFRLQLPPPILISGGNSSTSRCIHHLMRLCLAGICRPVRISGVPIARQGPVRPFFISLESRMGIARNIAVALLALSTLWFAPEPTAAQAGASGLARIAAGTQSALREWDRVVGQLERSGELRARPRRADTLLPHREHERLDQYFKGVRVFGANLARQTEGGVPVS